jgi:hypothetical protein
VKTSLPPIRAQRVFAGPCHEAPECLDDYVAEDNPVRVVEVFVDQLELGALDFEGADPAATGRLDREPEKMRVRRQTAEQPFGTIKHWMGSTHFLTKTLARVSTEMSLHVLAYNLRRLVSILAINPTLAVIKA